MLFAYVHTGPAQERFATAVGRVCGRRDGFDTWKLAVQMARVGRNATEIVRLASIYADAERTCAKSSRERAIGQALVGSAE